MQDAARISISIVIIPASFIIDSNSCAEPLPSSKSDIIIIIIALLTAAEVLVTASSVIFSTSVLVRPAKEKSVCYCSLKAKESSHGAADPQKIPVLCIKQR